MTLKNPQILVVEDDQTMGGIYKRLLEEAGYTVIHVLSAEDGIIYLGKYSSIEIVVTDYILTGMNGIEFLKYIKEKHPSILVVVITGYGKIKTAIEAIKSGAADYLTKPVEMEQLLGTIDKQIQLTARSTKHLQETIYSDSRFENIIGKSPAMKKIFEEIKIAANDRVTVFLTGETGTGKDLIARTIHKLHSPQGSPFIPVVCTALPHELFESELFGHRRGAFTGAHRDTQGLFLAAQNGTIYLDEIIDTTKNIQVKLLRVLQEGTIRPIGDVKEQNIGCRIIAATNQDVAGALKNGKLREDFYYRLREFVIEVPPLRKRKPDIPILTNYFIDYYCGRRNVPVLRMSEEATRAFLSYPWPGNVRELQNTLSRIVLFNKPGIIELKSLPPEIRETHIPADKKDTRDSRYTLSIKDAERVAVKNAIIASKGNKSEAAKILGISRKSLYKKLEEINKKR